MGAPVATIRLPMPFYMSEDQLSLYHIALSRGAMFKLTFALDPRAAEVTVLPTATISAAVEPWAADVEVTHREV